MQKIALILLTSSLWMGVASNSIASPSPHHGKRHHTSVKHLPTGAAVVVFKGNKYWISGGVYYRQQGKSYVTVLAPTGAKIRYLPNGAVVIKHKGKQYFKHAGVYYRWKPSSRQYEVVNINVSDNDLNVVKYVTGSVLKNLPEGAEATLINGVQYFHYHGQYMVSSEREGKAVYIVIKL